MKERRRMRLKDFNYSSQNFYFVTICALNKQKIFGKIESGNVILNKKGEIVKESFWEVTEHFTYVELDEFIIMPNHFHAIIIISGPVGLRSPQPDGTTKPDVTMKSDVTTKPDGTTKPDATSKPDVTMKPEFEPQPNTAIRPNIQTKYFTLSQVIAYFKYQSTKRINEAFHSEGNKIWQRSFYDRIIRNEIELDNVRKYIRHNALKPNS
jgi:REP element-mobilizing transposase RayT